MNRIRLASEIILPRNVVSLYSHGTTPWPSFSHRPEAIINGSGDLFDAFVEAFATKVGLYNLSNAAGCWFSRLEIDRHYWEEFENRLNEFVFAAPLLIRKFLDTKN